MGYLIKPFPVKQLYILLNRSHVTHMSKDTLGGGGTQVSNIFCQFYLCIFHLEPLFVCLCNTVTTALSISSVASALAGSPTAAHWLLSSPTSLLFISYSSPSLAAVSAIAVVVVAWKYFKFNELLIKPVTPSSYVSLKEKKYAELLEKVTLK